MSSCVGCKFLFGDGSGYSDWTWMETYVRCALSLNPKLDQSIDEEPMDWPPAKPEDDVWPLTKDGRCDRYSPGPFVTLSPDRSERAEELGADAEASAAINLAGGVS